MPGKVKMIECRLCGDEFAFDANKPGFFNECPGCTDMQIRSGDLREPDPLIAINTSNIEEGPELMIARAATPRPTQFDDDVLEPNA